MTKPSKRYADTAALVGFAQHVRAGYSRTVFDGTVTLGASGWSGGTQTVTATGMTSDAAVIVMPDASDADAYGAAGVACTGQGTDSLTFSCRSVPDADIVACVLAIACGSA